MYYPNKKILEKYADVLVNALNSDKGIKEKDVVCISVPDWAKPFIIPLRTAVLKAGGNPIISFLPTGIAKSFFLNANKNQISFFAKKYWKGWVDQFDHVIFILPDMSPFELEGIDPVKQMARVIAAKPLRTWRNKKEDEGKFSWTIGWWGTEEYATLAKMSLKKYWDNIIKACFLNFDNPVQKWKEVTDKIARIITKLNSIPIDKLHIKGTKTDLWVSIGKKRKWCGGGGCNRPSFEIFTSPDWRETEGNITFNQPLFFQGSVIERIQLTFKNGKVIKAISKTNQNILQTMVKQENADKLGEFSLTDGRFSPITVPMANTLFDENMGGPFGNMHIALGAAYPDTYNGKAITMKPDDWEKLGFNDPSCSIHTDIISTEDRIVTATLRNGKDIVIYKKGIFTV